ncbi:MAG: hypothetical protein IPI77_16885 [Saprospiraceae bacterium]|nr:hypothetical protein [Saprospiraceae bacterium]
MLPSDFGFYVQTKRPDDHPSYKPWSEKNNQGFQSIKEDISRRSVGAQLIHLPRVILTIIGWLLPHEKSGEAWSLLPDTIGISIGAIFVFISVFSSFSRDPNIPSIVRIWLPNIVFGVVAWVMVKTGAF